MSDPFAQLGLRAEILRALTELGYENPTPIQEGAIPALLAGRDVLGQAQTGTGKTAAYALPLLEQLDLNGRGVQALVLVPTRELAMQVNEAVYRYGRYLGARVLAIYGGQSYTRQIKRLDAGVHVVAGTPGRILDLIQRGALDLSTVRYLVLDEADEMLKMGFIDDVESILSSTPGQRQTALFSATLAEPIRRLAARYMSDPVSVTIAPKTLTVPQTQQRYHLVFEDSKLAVVARLLEVEAIQSALIFARTKVGAAQLAEALLARGFPVEAIHGDLSQDVRETVLRRFRSGLIKVLVATDVAARGLDIENVSHVINYDMPYDPEDYVHRIGRTGRAGRDGIAITLVTPRERRWLKTIEGFTKSRIEKVPLPSVEQVMAQRDAAFAASLQRVLAEDDLSRERAFAAELLANGYDLETISAAAIRLARASEAQRPIEAIDEPKERGEFPLRQHDARTTGRRPRIARQRTGREPGMVRLQLNLGRDQGVKPGDIVGAIAGEAGIPGRAIGAIDIRRNETFVDVEAAHVERVLRQMRRSTLRGRAIGLRKAE
ncbi:MAG: DEAD/DEAH box helicase [Aggregatilineales bacterium]